MKPKDQIKAVAELDGRSYFFTNGKSYVQEFDLSELRYEKCRRVV